MTVFRLGVAAAMVDGSEVPGDVVVDGGVVAAVGARPGGRRGLAVPGFVDLQVNGFAGVDLGATDLEGYHRVSAALARTGVTAYLATLPTSAPESYGPALQLAARAVDVAAHAASVESGAGAARHEAANTPAGSARAVGTHLEGPFLAPGRAGAHRLDWLRPPSRAAADALLDAGPVTLVTVAPELDGALELISHLRRRGVVVALGHSNADGPAAHRGFDAGASAVTHLWNAHRPVTARDPGLGGAALARPDVDVCLIADLVHVAPDTLRLTLAAAPGRAVVVSDAVAPAGRRDGDYTFSGRPVTLRDGAVRLADGTLAGSASTLDQALRNLVGLGAPLAAVVTAMTARPARLIGRGDLGRLVPGTRADIVVLDDDLTVDRTFVGGYAQG